MASARYTPLQVDVLVFEGCPHAGAAIALAREVVGASRTRNLARTRIDVDTPEKAAILGFLGPPPFVPTARTSSEGARPGTLCCRTYDGEGVPPEWMVEAAILRAVTPKGVLFLASPIQRAARWPKGSRVRSRLPVPDRSAQFPTDAGSARRDPVLGEIGIDISGYGPRLSRSIAAEGSTQSSRFAAKRNARFSGGRRNDFTGAFRTREQSRARRRIAFTGSGARAMNCDAHRGPFWRL